LNSKNLKTGISHNDDIDSFNQFEDYRETILGNNFKKFYLNDEYENYIVEYLGNIVEAVNKVDYASVSVTSPIFAVVAVKKGMINQLVEDVPEITFVEKSYPFTLSELKQEQREEYYKYIGENTLGLNGEGVIVGIIGTGIDYLNPRFNDDNGNTRIISIWDQTIESEKSSNEIYGTIFTGEQIQNAIKRKVLGQNPYDSVNHKDDTGYGTALAGIVGGRKLYKEDPYISVAPKCQFAIVKLKEAKKNTLENNAIDQRSIPIYEGTDIRFALRYLASLQKELNKPISVYLPLGSNFGGHNGNSPLERDIDYYVLTRGYTVVCNTGDEGDTSTHTSGMLKDSNDIKTIEINVGKNQKNLYLSVWLIRPDKVSIGIEPPVGNPIEKIPAIFSNGEEIVLDMGSSKVTVQYFISTISGDQFIYITINNVQGGLWKINLIGEYVLSHRYDSWIPQRVLLEPDTKFLSPDPYTTLTIPCTATNSITTAYFDTMTNTNVPKSGKGFTRDGRIKPGRCTAGTNILTTSITEKNVVVSGSAAAGAIIAGAVALLYQWGIVDKNDINLYTAKIRTYLIRGTIRMDAYEVPNETCGYGMFNFDAFFKGISSRSNYEQVDESSKCVHKMQLERNIFINIPKEIYRNASIKEGKCFFE
jgi:hypothetical protein